MKTETNKILRTGKNSVQFEYWITMSPIIINFIILFVVKHNVIR